MNVLVLVGSERADSVNAALARAAVRLLPADTNVTWFDRLGQLPFYSQDADAAGDCPQVVTEFRGAVAAADAILLVTPEYNGSVSGMIKNAIDIASRPRPGAAITDKPVAVIGASTSPRAAQRARAHAIQILTVAGADPIEETFGVGSASGAFDGDQLRDDELTETLAELLDRLGTRTALAA